jgi:tyrosyl-tRNA synthetase
MEEWIPLLTDFFPQDFEVLHPMEKKKVVAADIVRQLHGTVAGIKAAEHFERKIVQGQPEDVIGLSSGTVLEVVAALRECSKSEARRLLKGNAVSVDGERVSDPDLILAPGTLIKVGKRHWASITGE